jgi:hypothetical protein
MKKTSSFLTGFLAMLVAAGLLSSAGPAQAELISINIGSFGIGGINGGVSDNNIRDVTDFPISGGAETENSLSLYNNFSGLTGLQGYGGLKFATGGLYTPFKFSLNDSIGSSITYSYSEQIVETLFRYDNSNFSPDFGPGSYMGFQTVQDNYGWLKVTWSASSSQFQILSGAYESTPNVAILAGVGPSAAVPEPGTWAAAALLVGGAAFMRWRKRAKVA